MAKTIVTSAEREKRDLVANIAARGREAYKAKEDTVKPTQDLAAAASAAVKADPVDIPVRGGSAGHLRVRPWTGTGIHG